MSLPHAAVSVSDGSARAAVIAHGSASTAAFVTRVFAEPLASAGLRLVTWDRRTRPEAAVDELADLVEATDAVVVGGISIGGLMAARYTVETDRRLHGLLLALPPWLGPPDGVAAMSRAAADDIAACGLPEVLDRLAKSAPQWVAVEVAEAWRRWAEPAEDFLVDELRATATARGPTATDLASCRVPTGIAAFDDDPLHPTSAAEAWAAALPRSATVTLSQDTAALDRGVIGAAAVSAWGRALSESR